jgi:hypothetical protein
MHHVFKRAGIAGQTCKQTVRKQMSNGRLWKQHEARTWTIYGGNHASANAP